MNKKKVLLSVSIIFISLSIIIARSFRVSKIPHGSKASCNTCHTAGGGSPLNSFGKEVEKHVTPGGSESFWAPDIAALDSDGDGFTNGEELQDPNGNWVEGESNPGDAANVTNPGNSSDFPTSIVEFNDALVSYKLFNNYPNPFNPVTTIKFALPINSNVRLTIYDITGKMVKSLVERKLIKGVHSYVWNASEFSSGTYIYELKTDSYRDTKKMLLIK